MTFQHFLIWGIHEAFDNGLLRTVLARGSFGEVGRAALIGCAFALCIILPYLLGSVNFALVISRVFYHDDIRKHGSGNAGATNMWRTYGFGAFAASFLCDGFKGVVSILFACLVFGHPEAEGLFFLQVTACYLAMFFCIIGHVFPCFSHFRGGKGIATVALCIVVLNPAAFVLLFPLYIVLVALTRYISFGSVVCILLYPLVVSALDGMTAHYGVNTIFAFLIAMLITWCHRENIKRIMNRTERKLTFGKKKAAAATSETPSAASEADEEQA
ncbi:MAG: glycerol-3-phosphate 1-O-acyltransferase PlsY [Clostridia bacterium]|nr:glycerol-3-phosphate 1-O-acyltransferase PlsY [Clostridia bacterium]